MDASLVYPYGLSTRPIGAIFIMMRLRSIIMGHQHHQGPS